MLAVVGISYAAQAAAEKVFTAKQGEVLYLTVVAEGNPASVQGRFRDRSIPFFKTGPAGEYGALVGIDMADEPAPVGLKAAITYPDGRQERLYRVVVQVEEFRVQSMTLPKEQVEPDADALKRIMLEYMDKKGCGWDDPRITMMDLQYHDVKRTRGLYYLLERQELVERLVPEESVQRAMTTPPQSTRAKVRGDFIRFARAKNRSYTVDWTYLKLNGYWEETILCMDPFSSSNRRVEELLSQVSGQRVFR